MSIPPPAASTTTLSMVTYWYMSSPAPPDIVRAAFGMKLSPPSVPLSTTLAELAAVLPLIVLECHGVVAIACPK